MRRIVVDALQGAVILGSIASMSGCYEIHYDVTPARGATYHEERWNTQFLAGLVPYPEHRSIEKICGAGEVHEVTSYQNPANVLASVLSLSLVSANSVDVVCQSGRTPETPAARLPQTNKQRS